MSVLDYGSYWLSEATGGKIFPVNYSITIGDIVTEMLLGSRQTHLMGPDVKLVADLEAIAEHAVLGKLIKSLPTSTTAAVIGDVLRGVEGNVGVNIGPNIGATYGGPKVDIRRGSKLTATDSDTITGAPGGTVVILTLGALVAFLVAADLVVYFKYGNPPKSGKTATGATWEPNTVQSAYQALVPAVANRLLGFLTTWETKLALVVQAEKELKDAKKALKEATTEFRTALSRTLTMPRLSPGYAASLQAYKAASTKWDEAYAAVSAKQAALAALDARKVL